MSVFCYYCQMPVTPEVHANVKRAMSLLLGEQCDSEIHNTVSENSFVHMAQALPENHDVAGDMVICPTDFVREIAESLGPVYPYRRGVDGVYV